MTWIIKAKDGYFTETLFWSNEYGYTSHKEMATQFTDEEKNTMWLPLEGAWMEDN